MRPIAHSNLQPTILGAQAGRREVGIGDTLHVLIGTRRMPHRLHAAAPDLAVAAGVLKGDDGEARRLPCLGL